MTIAFYVPSFEMLLQVATVAENFMVVWRLITFIAVFVMNVKMFRAATSVALTLGLAKFLRLLGGQSVIAVT